MNQLVKESKATRAKADHAEVTTRINIRASVPSSAGGEKIAAKIIGNCAIISSYSGLGSEGGSRISLTTPPWC